MSTTNDVVRLEEPQFPVAADVLARAFFEDPLFTYVLPDSIPRHEQLLAFMVANCRYGHRFGEAHSLAGSVDGVALWAPPGDAGITPERLEAVGFGRVAEAMGEEAMGRFTEVMNYLEGLHHRDLPAAHWYLMCIGVDPARQGLGIGARLLQPILRRADAAGLPCYLETMTARNVPFYQKHGFEVVVETTVPRGGVRCWTMQRPPHPG